MTTSHFDETKHARDDGGKFATKGRSEAGDLSDLDEGPFEWSQVELSEYLYHGTSLAAKDSVGAEGHDAPLYLTDDEDLAWYYAEMADFDDYTVLKISTADFDPNLLEWDDHALAEPVGTSSLTRDLEELVAETIEDAETGDWRYSLWAVNSVRYTGAIPATAISEVWAPSHVE